jgi:hypothetical protein
VPRWRGHTANAGGIPVLAAIAIWNVAAANSAGYADFLDCGEFAGR